MNQYFEALASEYHKFALARVISQEKGKYRITYDGGPIRNLLFG